MPLMQSRRFTRFLSIVCLLAGVSFASGVRAQVNSVDLQIDTQTLGFEGDVVESQWTPMRLTLTSRAAEPRVVLCRWLLRDQDGDRIVAEREATLNPMTQAHLWLYAPVPVGQRQTAWQVQVIDPGTREILAQAAPPQNAPQPINVYRPGETRLIGVCGGVADLGLLDYASDARTAQEPTRLIRNLNIEELPDRWYGMSMLNALIWTQNGGDPGQMPMHVQTALRHYIERGGHLVIVLPAVGEPWSGSPLSDLLPFKASQMRRVESFDLLRLGSVSTPDPPRVPALVFDAPAGSGTNVVMTTDVSGRGDAFVVSHRVGFGRVTAVGIDLASPALTRLGLPNGRMRLWNEIFQWSTPAYNATWYKLHQDELKPDHSSYQPRQLGYFVPSEIAMTSTAAGPLLLAIVLFGAYWLIAGPLTFAVLKARGKAQYSWLAFLASVAVFTAAAWGMALFMQPQAVQLEHFSILDIDGNRNVVRTRSWFSVLIPHFGAADIATPAGSAPGNGGSGDAASGGSPTSGGGNTLANVGAGFETMDSTGFIDPQTYTFDAAAPWHMDVPARSTAKTFRADYMGTLHKDSPGVASDWGLPQVVDLQITNSFPQGTLIHHLPGDLRDVLIVYAPGDGNRPWVWRAGAWKTGEKLDLNTGGKSRDWLYIRLPIYGQQRVWKQEGYLGNIFAMSPGRSDLSIQATGSPDQIISDIEAMTFFDAMPPPEFRRGGNAAYFVDVLSRPLGHETDLSKLLDGRRLIVLGYLVNGPAPLPVTVDGHNIDQQSGWTAVRWIYDF